MTNGEWLEAKRDAFIEKVYATGKKFWDWIWKHIWVPILTLTIFIGVIITCGILIEQSLFVFLIPIGTFWLLFIIIDFSEWCDKEHKEKK